MKHKRTLYCPQLVPRLFGRRLSKLARCGLEYLFDQLVERTVTGAHFTELTIELGIIISVEAASAARFGPEG
jgi:hypothetical protein